MPFEGHSSDYQLNTSIDVVIQNEFKFQLSHTYDIQQKHNRTNRT